ncbi:MAG: hypothetical protein RL213_2031 [Bacteroidota bacterium]|jgi:ABC-type multidrug transport system ATPase subunit
MNDKILHALTQLFAIGDAIRGGSSRRDLVEDFLRQQLLDEQVGIYLDIFDRYTEKGGLFKSVTKDPADDDTEKHIRTLCVEITQGLEAKQKYVVYLRLCEFLQSDIGSAQQGVNDLLFLVSDTFRLSKEESAAIREMASAHPEQKRLAESGALMIHGHRADFAATGLHLELHDFSGIMWVVNLQRSGIMLVRYEGADFWSLNGQPADARRAIVLSRGSVLRNQLSTAIYFSDLQQRFLLTGKAPRLEFEVEDVSYRFRKNVVGIHPFSLHCATGELVSIMGGSGAGKSTLLNLLNGNLRPTDGRILINGLDVWKDPHVSRGLIGYIPQDDLLMEELTVFQNLYYNTKLCFGELDDWRITGKVNDMLKSIGLWEVRDLKVGDPLNKTISGGQRKRLNIALELIREPAILFVDEPTSGLSSRDAENVMDLLKQLALSGKLVFVVIHQPSSDIFKMFDRLIIIDKGGYLVYDGRPVEAAVYFRSQAGMLDSNEGVCNYCGTVNPEQVFNILEQVTMDEFGEQTAERRVTPYDWYRKWKRHRRDQQVIRRERISTPPPGRIAGFRKQLHVFFKRDLLSKLANRQYLLINLLEAPVLALVLATLLRFTAPGREYRLYYNDNIPAYLFICVVVALFIGLSVSGEEILRDRKIRKRESFLFLSRTAYLFSKIVLLFLVSAIQMASFVWVGNSILGINGMYGSFFWVLFSTACFSNLLGLNISSAMRSAVAVYILIPLMIIPQILLSGVIVKFNKLNSLTGTDLEVSPAGNLMASRWAYEALAVHQFRDNDYTRRFFRYDTELSRSTFIKDYWVRTMHQYVRKCERLLQEKTPEATRSLESTWRILVQELSEGVTANSIGLEGSLLRDTELPDEKSLQEIDRRLRTIEDDARYGYVQASELKEKRLALLTKDEAARKQLEELMLREQNKAMAEMLLNETEKDKIYERNGALIQQFEPVYREAITNRSFFQQPFFTAEKYLFGSTYETYTANSLVLWAMTAFLYLLLQFDVLNRLLNKRR